jgi:hypothetical protein
VRRKRKITTRRKFKKRRKRTTKRKSVTVKKEKSDEGVADSKVGILTKKTLNSKIAVRKQRRRRRCRRKTTKKRKVVKRRQPAVLTLNSLRIKKLFLDKAKERIVRKIQKTNELKLAMSQNLNEVINNFTNKDPLFIPSSSSSSGGHVSSSNKENTSTLANKRLDQISSFMIDR